MSEKRFKLNEKGSFILEDGEPLKPLGNVVHKLNEQQDTIERLKKLAKRTEEEKEHYADLYNQCRRLKLSDEAIKQAYADLNRREREKHSQGNATYTAKNQTEAIY